MEEKTGTQVNASSGTEQPANPEPQSLFEKWLKDGGAIMLDIGRSLGKTAEDLTGLMILHVEKEKRNELDLLVESGAVKTRAQGLKMLAEAGAKTKEQVFRRIEATREQINVLKKGLKDMAGIAK